MSISFHIDNHSAKIGSSSFLHAFFSTISYYLESKKASSGVRESKPTKTFKELYKDRLSSNKARKGLEGLLDSFSAFIYAFDYKLGRYAEPKKSFSDGWGSRYPELMNELYKGKLSSNKASKVLKDVYEIRGKLKEYSPEKIIWDIEDLKKSPPWGNNISSDITDLSNYFITSDGKDLFDVLIDCLKRLEKSDSDLIIE